MSSVVLTDYPCVTPENLGPGTRYWCYCKHVFIEAMKQEITQTSLMSADV